MALVSDELNETLIRLKEKHVITAVHELMINRFRAIKEIMDRFVELMNQGASMEYVILWAVLYHKSTASIHNIERSNMDCTCALLNR